MLVASTCSVKLFKRKQKLKTWRGLANCLRIASAGTIQRTKTSFARDVCASSTGMNIPALSKNLGRNRRDFHPSVKQHSSDTCPFNMAVVDFVNTVPRFLSKATCDGCDARCKPVMYTHQVLFNRCGNYWMWTQKTLEVAFVWKMED